MPFTGIQEQLQQWIKHQFILDEKEEHDYLTHEENTILHKTSALLSLELNK